MLEYWNHYSGIRYAPCFHEVSEKRWNGEAAKSSAVMVCIKIICPWSVFIHWFSKYNVEVSALMLRSFINMIIQSLLNQRGFPTHKYPSGYILLVAVITFFGCLFIHSLYCICHTQAHVSWGAFIITMENDTWLHLIKHAPFESFTLRDIWIIQLNRRDIPPSYKLFS